MAQITGLNRRAFLKNAGLTAVAGAVTSNTPLAAAAEVALAANGSFDFDTPYNRVGTDCSKWDRPMAQYGVKKLVAGMGIADMDFKAAPCITKALMERTTARGRAMVTGAEAHGRYLGRVCVLSFRTHQDRIEALIEDFAAVIRELR